MSSYFCQRNPLKFLDEQQLLRSRLVPDFNSQFNPRQGASNLLAECNSFLRGKTLLGCLLKCHKIYCTLILHFLNLCFQKSSTRWSSTRYYTMVCKSRILLEEIQHCQSKPSTDIFQSQFHVLLLITVPYCTVSYRTISNTIDYIVYSTV